MKKLFLTLFSLVWLQANSPPVDKEKDRATAILNDQNWKEPLTPNNVYNYLIRRQIIQVEIVFRQILQETGHLTSRHCVENNNLFGMTRTLKTVPPTVEYKRYRNWKQSVVDYQKWQTRHIDNGLDTSDYYSFLNKVRYAKDSLYTTKLKQININKYISH